MSATLLLAGVTIAAASAASGSERLCGAVRGPVFRACEQLGEIFKIARGFTGSVPELVGARAPSALARRRPAHERPDWAQSSLAWKARVCRRGLSLITHLELDTQGNRGGSEAVSDLAVGPSSWLTSEQAAPACVGDADFEEQRGTALLILGGGNARERDGPGREAWGPSCTTRA